MNCSQVRLSIWISKKPVLQGKVYQLDGKWVFLVNIDKNKLWYKYNGYSIATQVLEAFKKLKIRPLILYKYAERHQVFMATPSKFYKYGIPVNFGGHRQFILALQYWSYFKGELNEPFNLPEVTIDKWVKGVVEEQHYEGVSAGIYLGAMSKLWEMNKHKFAEPLKI
jgi:hypothetical protein